MSCPPVGEFESGHVRQLPGFAIIDRDQFVGFGIIDDALLLGVPLDFAAGAESDVAKVGDGGDVMADGEIFVRLLAGFHAIEEIPHMSWAGIAAAGVGF